MTCGGRQIPVELQDCPSDVLESYVRARVLAMAGSASVSRRLGLSAESIRHAFAETLSEEALLSSRPSDASAGGPPMELAFGHDCQSLGCLEPNCPLCSQNPSRRCSSCFSGKYLSGDVLKAKCGASIRVQVVNRSTLEPVKGSVTKNIYLEMCIIDGKAYQALQDAGREQYEEDVESCIIALNNQGKELLVPGRGATHNEDKWVVVQMARGEAHLPDLTVTGSSEALLSGQKPPFRLLVRAMNSSDGARAHSIRFSVSDAFVVATPRVRTAAKAEIPHLDDHVSKLHAVGNMTQNKLQDISAAAIAVGVYNIKVPYNVVTKVGQFRELVEVAEGDPQLCETLKKVLKLTRGWELARDHAMMAVSTDNQMRIWYASSGVGAKFQDGGLLFRCHLGSVDLDNPVGMLKQKGVPGEQQTTLEAILIQRLPAGQKEAVKRLQKQAAACWWQLGHPGWAIWPVDTQHFLQELAAPVGMLTSEPLISSTPAESLPTSQRPVTRATTHAAQTTDAHSSISLGSASENPIQGQQGTRSSTPSEGGASLDGWIGSHSRVPPPKLHNPASRATSSELRFPPQPQPQASTVWSHPSPQYEASGAGPLSRLDIQAMPWAGGACPMAGADLEQLADGISAPLQRPQSAPPPADLPLYRPWPPNSLGVGGAENFAQAGQATEPWPAGIKQEQSRGQLPSAYAGMRDYSVASQPLPGSYGGVPHARQPGEQQAMPTSGSVRKRESALHGMPMPAVSLPAGQSNPLPSPFGHPEMQNMELPVTAAMPRKQNFAPPIDARMSSGMEPASAKRPHYSPAVLQERLSHLFGRPVGAQEMSRLIPNFPDLLEDPNASHDLPSIPITTSDLASLMDYMLEPRSTGGQSSGGQTAREAKEQAAGPGSDFFMLNSYTYGDLADAVNMMHEGRAHPTANAGLDNPRSSSMLVEYMAARLAGPEGQILAPEPVTASQPPIVSDAQADILGGSDLLQSQSGLERMQDIEQALPAPAGRVN